MKKTILFFTIIMAFYSCKNEQKTEETPQQVNYVNGDFLLNNNAAILQTKTEIYAVKIDAKAKELATKSKQYQKTEYDMVPVSLKAVVIKNPNDGWERMLIVKEILKVAPQKVPQEIIELKAK